MRRLQVQGRAERTDSSDIEAAATVLEHGAGESSRRSMRWPGSDMRRLQVRGRGEGTDSTDVEAAATVPEHGTGEILAEIDP